MKIWPRVVIASILAIATSCSLAYDVDSITSDGECGAENAPCCDGTCNTPSLQCNGKTCQRCATAGSKCCLDKNLANCAGDSGAVKLAGTCDEDSNCVVPCSAGGSCSALSTFAQCCIEEKPACETCDGTCICRVCCASCAGGPYTAIAVATGQGCNEAAQAKCSGEADSLWSATGC